MQPMGKKMMKHYTGMWKMVLGLTVGSSFAHVEDHKSQNT